MMKLRDWPDAERYARMLLAMAPPEVQAIANEGQEGEEEAPSPQVQDKMRQMQQQMQKMGQMLDAGEQHVKKMEADAQRLQAENQKLQAENQKLQADRGIGRARLAGEMESAEAAEDTARYRAETERMKALGMIMPTTQTLQADEHEADDAVEATEVGGPSQADLVATVQALMQRQAQMEALLMRMAGRGAEPEQAEPPESMEAPQA
jgi:predicted nuclease with TOPRIM domain